MSKRLRQEDGIALVMALGIKQVETRLLRWRPEYQKR